MQRQDNYVQPWQKFCPKFLSRGRNCCPTWVSVVKITSMDMHVGYECTAAGARSTRRLSTASVNFTV
jgi:hypothetical protein